MTGILDAIFSRRSIRRFKEREVDRELLVQLLQAAMAAPTASNSQPWEFIAIDQRETMDRLRAKLMFARYNAPAAIVVLGNPGLAHNTSGKHFWVQDCSAATENILIAAAGLGLGAVWIGVYPLPSVMKAVREILAIPEDVFPLCLVMVGWPDENKPARTQYEERRVYWGVYEPRKRRPKLKNARYQP
jgi:nitroreductase